jgi:hypothetical protein
MASTAASYFSEIITKCGARVLRGGVAEHVVDVSLEYLKGSAKCLVRADLDEDESEDDEQEHPGPAEAPRKTRGPAPAPAAPAVPHGSGHATSATGAVLDLSVLVSSHRYQSVLTEVAGAFVMPVEVCLHF